MILVDTSVWIKHFGIGLPELRQGLLEKRVLMHPMVIGELACGNLPNRTATLRMFEDMDRISEASHEEVLDLIETEVLMGTGIGYIDTHLLCSALKESGTLLWTQDSRLETAAKRLGVAFKHPLTD